MTALLLASCSTLDSMGVVHVWVHPPEPSAVVVDGELLALPDDGRLELSEGRHQLCFGEVSGYVTPPCTFVDVKSSTMRVVNVNYDPQHGSVSSDPHPRDSATSLSVGATPLHETRAGRMVPEPHGEELRLSEVGLSVDPVALEASGAIETSARGQVIENLDIEVSGYGSVGILISHDDVVVRNVRIRHSQGANGIEVAPDVNGVLIERSHLDGMLTEELEQRGSIGVVIRGGAQVRRLFLERYRTGMHLYGSDAEVTENWLDRNHNGLTQWKGAGIAYRGGTESGRVVISRNRINYTATQSAGINVYAESGPVRNLTVEHNFIIGNGGGWGTYGGEVHQHRGLNRNIRYLGNRFDGSFAFPDALGEGSNAAVNMDRPGALWIDNRWAESGAIARPRCGIRTDEC